MGDNEYQQVKAEIKNRNYNDSQEINYEKYLNAFLNSFTSSCLMALSLSSINSTEISSSACT